MMISARYHRHGGWDGSQHFQVMVGLVARRRYWFGDSRLRGEKTVPPKDASRSFADLESGGDRCRDGARFVWRAGMFFLFFFVACVSGRRHRYGCIL